MLPCYFPSEYHFQGTTIVSFSSVTSTLKLKTHSQLTQTPFTGTDCLFLNDQCKFILLLATLSITLLDVNDNDPEWVPSNMYTATVSEGSSPGVEVKQVTAIDRDLNTLPIRWVEGHHCGNYLKLR